MIRLFIKFLKKIPGVKKIARYFGFVSPPVPLTYVYQRMDLSGISGLDFRIYQIKNMLNYCKTTRSSDAGHNAGYQSVNLKGEHILGRRNPRVRLEVIGYDFSGKAVLDIGCNQGGMLFSLADVISVGIGIDYEVKVINACHAIRYLNEIDNLNFFVFDLDHHPLENILDLIPESGIDVVFLLAVCQHIKKWRELISFVAKISPTLIFEANGNNYQKSEQARELEKYFKSCRLIYEKSPDDSADRSLWIATN
jgi:2-polyprenyl-3-methyl-5-hydroxy-6-metoxy-1,4-benzoquinol methylase